MDKHLIWAITVGIIFVAFAVAWGASASEKAQSDTARSCIRAGGEWTTVKGYQMGCKK